MGWIKHAITQCFIILRQIQEQEIENKVDKKSLYKFCLR